MWHRILAQARARRASRAAVVLISPLVERSRRRLNGIAKSTWSEPYIIGFMTMMITITARLESPSIQGSLLCDVQEDAWTKITGSHPSVVGEEILLLSASRHSGFELGCRDAVEVYAELSRRTGRLVDGRHVQEWILTLQENEWSRAMKVSTPDETARAELDLLWASHFDTFCNEMPHCKVSSQDHGLGSTL